MKAEDIILRIATELPKFSDKFTSNFSVNDITRSGDEFIVKLDEPHNFAVNKGVTINGATTAVSITTFTRNVTVGTITTATDHDLTKGIAPTVTTSGFTDGTFNGTFTVLKITSNTTIVVQMADSGGASDSGGSLLDAGTYLDSYNGTYGISRIITDSSFAVNDGRPTVPAPVVDSGTLVRAGVRISGGVNLERLLASYTDEGLDGWWLFVVLEDSFASKDRTLQTDAIQDASTSEYFRQQVIQQATIYAINNVTKQYAGRQAKDDAADIFSSLCHSILFHCFDSHFGIGEQGNLHFLTHGTAYYDTAIYAHAFTFQQTCDLNNRDIIDPSPDVSFKKFSLTINPSTGDDSMQTADIEMVDPL